jgi:sigma-B regulation protein RsbU (phosphoserine phosphatase)
MASLTPILLADIQEGAKVLVVDDSRAQRHLMSSTLTRAGYRVITAASAEEALEVCADPEIRLIVSDWGMPGMDGPEFCAALRDMDRPYTYFILITSKSDRKEIARGLDAGADDFVTRPINWHELKSRIRAGERIVEMQEQLREKTRVVEATLSELRAINVAMERDLAEARKLQMSLMPPAFRETDAVDIASRLLTCGQVGGDLVGSFPVSETKLGLYSIDVSGHGVASALMTGRLSGLFSATEPHRNVAFSTRPGGRMVADAPEKVVARLNELMLDDLDTDIYFTCILAYLDLETGELELCQAGHPHPLLLASDGNIAALGGGGPPVGLISGLPFEKTIATLNPGDRLFLFSDGCSECTNPADEMLGEEGLAALIQGHTNTALRDILTGIEVDLRGFTDGREFEDDVSMIFVEYKGA